MHSNTFSAADVDWSSLETFIKDLGRERSTVSGNGECFLSSVQIGLESDYGINDTIHQLKEKIMDEVIENADIYKDFHQGQKRALLERTLDYLKYRKFTDNVVDVIIPATSKALKVNLYILQRCGTKVQLIPTECEGSNIDIFLKYDRHGGTFHGFDHYTALTKIKSKTPVITNSSPPTNKTKSGVDGNTNTAVCVENAPNNTPENGGNTTTNQERVSEGTDEERIITDMLNGCQDDTNGYYFDEYGVGLCSTQGNDPPSRPQTDDPYLDEVLMTLEEFAGVQNNQLFIPSQEDSDVEPEPYQLERDSSDEEVTEIPEKFKRDPRPRMKKYGKTKFNRAKFLSMDVEMVDKLPWDVDGDHSYKILNCDTGNDNNWNDRQKDGRWFKMNSSSRKGFDGIVKIGRCQGSLICQWTGCPKLKTEGVCNISEFQAENGAHICKCCGYYAVQIYCGCKKLTEYDPSTKELSVWYEGEHNCIPKPDVQTKQNFLKTLPLNVNLRLTPREMKNDCMRYFFTTGQIEKAMEVARLMDDNVLLEKMRYMKPGPMTSDYAEDIAVAFSNIADLKEETDKYDKFLIYRFNCGKTNGGSSFVFKTSRHHLDMALKMDPTRCTINGKRSQLAYEKAYFDGMHKRVRGFKTLTLWLHHPALRKMKRLATMDVQRENKEMVALFFELFNEALREYTGDKNYKFNPTMIVTDEAGAIHQGLHEVFGHNFLERISTCQWHFKRCAWKQLRYVKPEFRSSFREAVHGICNSTTVYEYELYAAKLDYICGECNIMEWWNWWKVRRYHLVPALRGFGWTGTNWAEIGQSKMKKHIRIWLIGAVWEDILNAVSEESDWLNFVNNSGKTIGKGPTLLAKRLKERRQMRQFTESAIDAFHQGRVEADVDKHRDPDKFFLGSTSAKHKVPRSFSRKNPTQEAQGRGRGRGRGRGCGQGRGRGRGCPSTRGRGQGIEKGKGEKTRGTGRGRAINVLRPPGEQIEDKVISIDEFEEVDVGGNVRTTEDTVEIQDFDEEETVRYASQPTTSSTTSKEKEKRKRKRRVYAEPTTGPRRNPDRTRRGKNRKYTDCDGYSTDEDLRPYDNRRPTGEQERTKLAANPPTYVFLRKPDNGKNKKYPKRCNGCLMLFADGLYKEPVNLVFRFKMIRQWTTDDGTIMRTERPQNAYFHSRDMACLKRCDELEMATINDVYILQECFANLTEEHRNLLRQRKHWIPIRRNRAAVIDSPR